jgi:hypothetical protein
MDEDRDMENTVGIQVEVLMPYYLSMPLKKSLAGSAGPCSMNRANMEISSGFFSIGYGSP